jgi:formylglycine-generating enzyme required for sulfatase activity
MNSEFKTRPPGQKKPNELGIYDMNGNIGEWCCDRYDKQYYENSPSADPGGPTTGSTRSYRGGGFSDPRELLRPAVRFNHAPGYKNYDLGVRLVKNDSNAGPPPPGMVLVQGGTFKMGSTEGKYGEKIVHPVTLTDFYIGKFEITQEEWKATMGNYPAERIGVKTPISFVDWYGAVEYCNKRSRMEGLTPCYTGSQDRITCNFDAEGYRLPTEAEWEYAARGGIKSRHFKYSGSNDINEVGLCIDNLSLYFEPVGKRKANELGIYDMSGNMWEWCWDWYDFDYYKTGAGKNLRGPMTGIRRVIRGGSWFVTKECQWSTFRFYEAPHRKNTRIGFRVVRSVPGENENSY